MELNEGCFVGATCVVNVIQKVIPEKNFSPHDDQASEREENM